jgi:amino acid transporter
MAEEKLFLRKATGLVREIGFATAVIIILCNVIGLGWQKRVFQAGGWAPVKASDYFLGIHPMVMSFLLIGVVVLITVYCVAVMAAAMPRSGGGYVFISRILHPGLGFVTAWMATFSTALSYGLIGVAGAEAILIFGGAAGLGQGMLDTIATPGFLFLWGLIMIAIFSAIGSMGVQMTGRFLQIIFVIPAVVLIIVYLLFLTASPAALTAGVKNIYNADAVAYIRAAVTQGIDKAAQPYWGAVATATIASVWAYGGYYAASFVAGEVKEASRNMPRILFTAGVLIIFVYCSISFLLNGAIGSVRDASGWSFGDAVAFLNFGGGDFKAANLPSVGGWMSLMAMIVASGNGFGWLLPLILLFGVLWVLNDIPPFLLTSSRTVFAMAFDRVFPEKFGEISEKYHSPIWAIWFVSAIAVLGAVSEANALQGLKGTALNFVWWILSPGVMLAATDVLGVAFDICLALSALLFVTRKPEIFSRSAWQQNKSMVQVLGGLATIAQVWIMYVILTDSHSFNLLNAKTFDDFAPFLFVLLIAVIGAGIYWYYTNKAKQTGVSMTTIFTEIPPE